MDYHPPYCRQIFVRFWGETCPICMNISKQSKSNVSTKQDNMVIHLHFLTCILLNTKTNILFVFNKMHALWKQRVEKHFYFDLLGFYEDRRKPKTFYKLRRYHPSNSRFVCGQANEYFRKNTHIFRSQIVKFRLFDS